MMLLVQIVEHIGPYRFRGLTSDNTGNTSVARELLVADYPWMFDLPDPVHRIQLMEKDIGNLEYFKPVSLLPVVYR